jgi:thiol-disulfide isomerase/thioredoxin
MLIAVLFTTAGCPKAALVERVDQLEANLTALQAEVAQLKTVPAEPAPPAAPTAQDEEAAEALFKQVVNAIGTLETQQAKELFATLEAKYSQTKIWNRAKRMGAEIEIIGKDAGALQVSQWYQGKVNMDDGKATLLVFWEKWCPHCKREVPSLEKTYQKYKDSGLNIVGITKGSRGVTDDQVTDFLKQHKVQYPNAKDATGKLSTRFGIRGIPAAAIIQNGKVVWRGHPARISDAMLDTLLQ